MKRPRTDNDAYKLNDYIDHLEKQKLDLLEVLKDELKYLQELVEINQDQDDVMYDPKRLKKLEQAINKAS